MPTWITLALEVLANVTGFAKKKQELKNAPDVRDRAKSQSEVNQVAACTKAVATNDTKELRDELAE